MDDSLTVRISLLQHFAYCPRKAGLVGAEGQWEDNRHTVRGQRAHRRVDSGAQSVRPGVTVLRSVPLWSEELGLAGKADVIEVGASTLTLVEYKAGTNHLGTADVQLCAQALCLEEMFGVPVPEGVLWLGATRRRERVELTERLRERTRTATAAVREMLVGSRLPDAPNDQRCGECQLRNRCLPEVTCGDDRSVELTTRLFEVPR